jgi:dTDP-4-dehydrorhamnose reductase
MRILVLGAQGMMGHMACRVLRERHDVIGTVRSAWDDDAALAHFLPREACRDNVDVLDDDRLHAVLDEVRPDAVINCVGIVKQLAEAKDAVASILTNSLLPHRAALACSTRSVRLIHLSTDCVFSGRAGNYTTDDVPDPIDLYGRSKLLGETVGGEALTIRTSIVGRQLTNATSLFEWVLASRGTTVRGFRRAVYSGLTTTALARVIEKLLTEHPDLTGVWQVASSPITKYDLLLRLDDLLGLGLEIVPDDTFVCDRSLDGSEFTRVTGINVPTWDVMLRAFADDQPSYDHLTGAST